MNDGSNPQLCYPFCGQTGFLKQYQSILSLHISVDFLIQFCKIVVSNLDSSSWVNQTTQPLTFWRESWGQDSKGCPSKPSGGSYTFSEAFNLVGRKRTSILRLSFEERGVTYEDCNILLDSRSCGTGGYSSQSPGATCTLRLFSDEIPGPE